MYVIMKKDNKIFSAGYMPDVDIQEMVRQLKLVGLTIEIVKPRTALRHKKQLEQTDYYCRVKNKNYYPAQAEPYLKGGKQKEPSRWK